MPRRSRFLRFLGGTALVAVILAVGFSLARPWLMHWGATESEVKGALPGDGLVPQPYYEQTLAITIDAPTVEIWSWLLQIGQDRGGFYSYDWLENLFGCDIHNAERIVPEWQQRQVGDFVSVCSGVGGWWIQVLEPERALVFGDEAGSVPVALALRPLEGGRSRLIARMRLAGKPGLVERILALDFWWTHALMQRGMLQGIKARAEGVGDLSVATAAEIGAWLAALVMGLVAAAGAVIRRDWRWPLVIGMAALLALLVQTYMQPPVWICVLLDVGLLLGLWWAFHPGRHNDQDLDRLRDVDRVHPHGGRGHRRNAAH